MNARQLKHFVAVVEAGNIQKAARSIHLTAPALSISLKNLEDDLGVKLLHKGRNGVQMTYAGEVFLKGANSLLTEMDDLRASLFEAEGSPAGKVRIGIPFGVSNAIAAPLFKIMLEEYPGINLEIEEGVTTSLEHLFDNKLLDLMINYNAENKFDQKCEILYLEHMYLVSPYDPALDDVDEVKGEDLSLNPIVASPGTHSLRAMTEQYARGNGIEFDYLLDFKSGHASIKIVEEGLAHTISPWSLIYDHVNTKLVSAQKIVEPQMERTAYMVSSLKKTPSAATRITVEAIKRSLVEAVEKDHLRAHLYIDSF